MAHTCWLIVAGVVCSSAATPPVVLFDGTSDAAWIATTGAEPGWEMTEGEWIIQPGSGSVMTKESFASARYHIEFLVPEMPPEKRGQSRGNSGVYIQNLYEVQILDSAGVAPGNNLCGAIYGQRAPSVNAALPAGQWQAFDIDFTAPTFHDDGRKNEPARMTVIHNGVVIHDHIEIAGPTGAASVRPEGSAGPLVLQDHGSAVRYRNLWVQPREADATEAKRLFEPIFDGATLEGWERRGGKAEYTVFEGQIVGQTKAGQPNSFMCTTANYADFELDLWFRVDAELNSGVQVRSAVRPNGIVYGYQIEIDPSERAWTGGLYEESARGWIDPLTEKHHAQQAFKHGEWNHLRAALIGHHVRTWLNGVPAVDVVDHEGALDGFIGLQVHGVGARTDPLQVRWRDITLRSMSPTPAEQD